MYKWNNFYKIRETVSAIKNVIAFLKRSGLSENILTEYNLHSYCPAVLVNL